MPEKPNILDYMVDQQRGDSVYPYSRAITPNAEKLAQEGVTFSRTFCSAPHCSPSRATFWTGLYPSQHGVWNNVNVGNALTRGLYDGVKVWSEDFDPDEYRLRFCGKWHVSAHETPADRGFENADGSRKSTESRRDTFSLSAPPSTYEWDRHKERTAQKMAGTEGPQRGGVRGGKIERPGYCTFWLYGHGDDWPEYNRDVGNAIEFLKGIEPQRQRRVLYEDLVTDPEPVMRGICAFLGIPFDDAVLRPYQGGSKTYELGDPNLLDRSRIDPALATGWKENPPPQQLSPFTQEIAAELGYDLEE